ncbi:unnamed protein product, partial [Cylicostephanus goldi]
MPNHFTLPSKPSRTNLMQLPTITCQPIRQAPRPPVPLTLDSPIPVCKEPPPMPEYVPMNPPKSLRILPKDNEIRLPPIAPKLQISDPIPIIVAGKVVNEQALRKPPPLAKKPSQDFIASLEDTLRVQNLERKTKLPQENRAT